MKLTTWIVLAAMMIGVGAQGQTTKPATRPSIKTAAPAEVHDFWAKCQDEKRSRLERALLEKGRMMKVPARERNREKLVAMNDWIADLRRPEKIVYPDLWIIDIRVGAIGHVRSIKVSQVIDGSTALAQIVALKIERPYWRSGGPAALIHVESWQAGGPLLWVEGIDTGAAADETVIAIGRLMCVTGTRQYDSNSGQRTVFVLKPFDLQRFLE